MKFEPMLIPVFCGLVTSLALVGLVRWLARRHGLVVDPVARSSHVVPTPTAGGIGIVVPTLFALTCMAVQGVADAGAVAIGGGLLAAVGLWDDFRELSAGLRLCVQAIGVALVLYVLADGWSLAALLLVGFLLLWNVNLFNFMDGIDGIAVVQTLFYCIGVLLLGAGMPEWLAQVNYVLVGAGFGFLAYNWPPASIFMGDVSSGFLGMITGVSALLLHESGMLPFIPSLILLAAFWFDASYTLLVRIATRQRFLEAHRSHLYQHLAARKGHRWTTLAFLAHGVLWLLPNAALATVYPELSIVWLGLTVIPLALGCWWFGAGLPDGRASGRLTLR